MDRCFVIQPFDKGMFDKRFKDIFKPAIEKAHLEAYRIDMDLSVAIPIQDIEKGIAESKICFADISIDNPNVWYELGFAFACGKDVVMVCSEDRLKFPFDIQHKSIIRYKTGSKSDFEELEETITNKIIAIQKKAKTIDVLSSSPVTEKEGLKSHEISLLILIMQTSIHENDFIAVYALKQQMSQVGYNDIATSVGVRTLSKKGMVETFKAYDNYANHEEYTACRITDIGENWILENEDQIEFKRKDEDEFTPPF